MFRYPVSDSSAAFLLTFATSAGVRLRVCSRGLQTRSAISIRNRDQADGPLRAWKCSWARRFRRFFFFARLTRRFLRISYFVAMIAYNNRFGFGSE